MRNVQEAKKLCPELIAQHVATWKEGDEKWAYHDDAAANIATHKVSLDPYRLESRKILSTIKESLPSDLQKVEKASIDEVFLDLSGQIHSILLQRFTELAHPPPYDDPSEQLPLPSISALDWGADALVDLDEVEAETADPDWDDVAMLIGSEIVREVRAAVRQKLKYTCSAGIAHNKMLSKLGSGYKKPNQQTVIRNRAIRQFLGDFKITKIRNLGGKLGDQVVDTFQKETVQDLLSVPVEQMKLKLGDDTGLWVYNTIRGIDTSEVNSRTQIKSMLSAKSFRPSINTYEQGVRWLRIFVADIFSRLVEEGVLENKRRPKTINLHHRHGGQTRSRQSPIPQGKILDEETLFDLAKSLLSQIVLEGRAWPCANLSLSVGGFEDGITGNKGIGAFLVRGEEAQALNTASSVATHSLGSGQTSAEKRKANGEGPSIERFFSKRSTPNRTDFAESSDMRAGHDDVELTSRSPSTDLYQQGPPAGSPVPSVAKKEEVQQMGDSLYACPRCDSQLETHEALQSHQDWHMAKDLQDEEERGTRAFVHGASTAMSSSGGGSRKGGATQSKKAVRSSKISPGQTKLKFG